MPRRSDFAEEAIRVLAGQSMSWAVLEAFSNLLQSDGAETSLLRSIQPLIGEPFRRLRGIPPFDGEGVDPAN
jgi:hypothetical protein